MNSVGNMLSKNICIIPLTNHHQFSKVQPRRAKEITRISTYNSSDIGFDYGIRDFKALKAIKQIKESINQSLLCAILVIYFRLSFQLSLATMYSNGLPGSQSIISCSIRTAAMNLGYERWRTSVILVFKGRRQSANSNGWEPWIRMAATILKLEFLRTSNSNGAAGAICGFELLQTSVSSNNEPRIRMAGGSDANGGGKPQFRTAKIHLDLETIKTWGITWKWSKGSFCLQISRDLNWRRMGRDPVRCVRRRINRLGGGQAELTGEFNYSHNSRILFVLDEFRKSS